MQSHDIPWGPTFAEYSKRPFNPERTELSSKDAKKFFTRYGVLPLGSLESLLYEADPRRDFASFKVPKLSDILKIVQAYMDVTSDKVFHNYYGFLCFRHLLHSTCLAVLKETGLLVQMHDTLRRFKSWESMASAVAYQVLELAGAAAAGGKAELDKLDPIFDSPNCAINTYHGDTNLLMITDILWEDRDSLLTLTLNGLLPGIGVLLMLVGFHMFPQVTSTRSLDFLYLQDLASRLYLIGSLRDRQICMLLCGTGMERGLEWKYGEQRFVSADDSHKVANAYLRLFEVYSDHRESLPIIPVAFMHYIYNFVQQVVAQNPSVPIYELIEVAHTSLKFLWLFFEVLENLKVNLHLPTRAYATFCFFSLGFIQKRLQSPEDQYMLVEVLSGAEFVALAGRVLLLVTAEANDCEFMDGLDMLIAILGQLDSTVSRSVGTAPSLFAGSGVEHAKVAHQIKLSEALQPSRSRSNSGLKGLLNKMIRTWSQFDGSLGDNIAGNPYQGCAYPRCFEPYDSEIKLRKLPTRALGNENVRRT
ncbi:hypothetical protein RhiJN_23193 [Ceratobasidium sp. AG-Ba]|nr:hypothetical protein RhiJN_23193 [Ceratobasidium sp. AG-Ba]